MIEVDIGVISDVVEDELIQPAISTSSPHNAVRRATGSALDSLDLHSIVSSVDFLMHRRDLLPSLRLAPRKI